MKISFIGISSIVLAAITGMAVIWVRNGNRNDLMQSSVPLRPDLSRFSDQLSHRISESEKDIRRGDDAKDALISLSRMYHANGYYDEAITCYEGLIQVESGNAKWPHLLASIYAKYGMLEESLPLLHKTVDLSAEYTPAWIRLGNSYLKLNRAAEAATAYQSALEHRPNDPHALFGLARIEAYKENWSAVSNLLENSTVQSSVRIGIDLLVTAYEKTGMNEKALSLRGEAKASSMHNELPDPWIMGLYDDCFDGYQLALVAGAAETIGDTQTAIRRLKQAIDLEPEIGLYPTQLGILYRKLNRQDEAIQYLETAIGVDPRKSDPWAYLVAIHKEQGNLVESEIALENGLKHCPDSYDLRMGKGRLISSRGNYAKANEFYLLASQVRFDSAAPLIEAAANCFKLEQIDRGKQLLKQALVAEPDHPIALTTLAFAAIVTREQRTADEVLERINLKPRISADDLRNLLTKYKQTFGEAPQ